MDSIQCGYLSKICHISALCPSPLHKSIGPKPYLINLILYFKIKKKKKKSYNLDGNKAECRGGELDQGAPFPFRGRSIASLGHHGWRYSTIPNEVT